MKRTYYILRVIGVLLVVQLITPDGHAQRADTLRRSLTVMTTEQVKLGEQQPLSFTLAPPPSYQAPHVRTEVANLPKPSDVFALSPLSALAPLPHVLGRNTKQKGYIELDLGLRYSGTARAGVKLVNTDRLRLDVGAWGEGTRYDFTQAIYEVPIRELRWGAQAHMDYVARRTRITANLSHSYQRHNLYGLSITPPSLSVDELARLTGTNLKISTTDAGVNIVSLQPSERGWLYRINPQITFSLGSGVNDEYAVSNQTELISKLTAGVWRMNGPMQFGIDFEGSAYNYNHTRPIELPIGSGPSKIEPYTVKSLIVASPYWRITKRTDKLRYGAKLGAGLSMYHQRETSGMQLGADIEGYLRWHNGWSLALGVGQLVRPNGMVELARSMPYMHLGHDALMTRIPLFVKAEISGRLSSNLILDLLAEYQLLRDAVNWLPQVHSRLSGSVDGALGFLPHNVDRGHQSIIKGGITYRHAGLWDMRAELLHRQLSEGLWGRPSNELTFGWQWHATQTWRAGLEYKLLTGIRYPGVDELRPLHTLSLMANYRLATRWGMRASAQMNINADGKRYMGYTPQRFIVMVGASYVF